MVGTVRDWRIDLIEAHPTLFQPPWGRPDFATGYPLCKEGWRDLLERLCARLEAARDEHEKARILRVKKELGGLRFSWRCDAWLKTEAKIHEAFALAEARSNCICEACGQEGQLYRDQGDYMIRCAAHARGAPVSAEPGWVNVYVLRFPMSDGYRIAPWRYDRDTDSFTDVDPHSLGIEEE